MNPGSGKKPTSKGSSRESKSRNSAGRGSAVKSSSKPPNAQNASSKLTKSDEIKMLHAQAPTGPILSQGSLSLALRASPSLEETTESDYSSSVKQRSGYKESPGRMDSVSMFRQQKRHGSRLLSKLFDLRSSTSDPPSSLSDPWPPGSRSQADFAQPGSRRGSRKMSKRNRRRGDGSVPRKGAAFGEAAQPSLPSVQGYYKKKIEELESVLLMKSRNIRRLQAERNELNGRVRHLREELERLRSRGSFVAEVIKRVSDNKVLVNIPPDEKYIVDVDPEFDIHQVIPNCRVALREDSYKLYKILPDKVDPFVSLMMVEKIPDSNFAMIGGLEKQIREIKEVTELPMKHPELFEALGIAQPKGVLLYGPPGTGKTLVARAIAHHSKCAFIRVSGSELVQKFIGEGSRMVRDIFVMARKHAPAIIFVDEIDSIGGARSNEPDTSDGTDSEVHRTMLELLNQLDGFEPTQNIKVIMATNRIDILDPALLRSGRLDRKIEFPPPNEDARLEILRIHSSKMNLTRNVNLRKIAAQISGASGAEMKGICTEAGMFALRERRTHVTQEDFEMAVSKVISKQASEEVSLKKAFPRSTRPLILTRSRVSGVCCTAVALLRYATAKSAKAITTRPWASSSVECEASDWNLIQSR